MSKSFFYNYLNAIVTCIAFLAAPGHAIANDAKQSFNDNWLFMKGELAGAESVDFKDNDWRKLRLPHDWSIEGPFDKKYSARNGGLPVFGEGWYRKTFTLPNSSDNKSVFVTFDGAMDNAEVFVNGKKAGERPYGYIAFEVDITGFLNEPGTENLIAVKVAPENYSERWYSGAGIYRNTWIQVQDKVHVKQWSTFVSTPKVEGGVALVDYQTEIHNMHSQRKTVQIKTDILTADNKLVVSKQVQMTIKSGQILPVEHLFTLNEPRLWDITDPYRYQVVTKVISDGDIISSDSAPLGIRTIEYKPNDGFWLNGRRVQIQGVCLHHDNGPLGGAVSSRAIERKFEIMQEMGANSVRTSHNPPSPEMVELADKMGVLLQVEGFDMWRIPKTTVDNGYNKDFDEWHERDLRDMIKQYRNNPSVIMWSIGNEVMEQKEKDGWKLARKLQDIAHDEDPTRLVTNGLSMYPDFLDNKMAEEMDIVGLNYKAYKYKEIKDKNPDWIMVGTETSSVVSTRGVYHFPLEKYRTHESKYVSSFDLITPPWAYIPDLEFEHLKNNPSVMGEYVWTGFDYIGEPTPYGGRDHGNKFYWNQDWPARSSSFGIVDLVGFKKDRFYLYQSQWDDKPMVHLLPHWSWPNRLGQSIPVMVYTNADEVELFVNGKSQGRKVMGKDKVRLPIDLKHDKETKYFDSPYRLMWNIDYQPGSVKAVAYKDNVVVAEKQINTAGAAYQVELVADKTEITADGYDLSYVSALVKDREGNLVPDADNLINFKVSGAGEVAAVGNGDSATVEPFIADYRRAFNGKAMLIIKSINGKKGNIKVQGYSSELEIKPISISAK